MKIGDEEVLTINQAAERIGISPITLRLQVRRGKVTAERFGRQWVIRAAEVERYRRDVQGKPGFAAETHPYHGQRPPRKGDQSARDSGKQIHIPQGNDTMPTPRSGDNDTERAE